MQETPTVCSAFFGDMSFRPLRKLPKYVNVDFFIHNLPRAAVAAKYTNQFHELLEATVCINQ
jgi:hypothetical protein